MDPITKVVTEITGTGAPREIAQRMQAINMPPDAPWRRVRMWRPRPQWIYSELWYPVRAAPGRWECKIDPGILAVSEGWERLKQGYLLDFLGREPPAGALSRPGGMPLLQIDPLPGATPPTPFTIQIWQQLVRHEGVPGYVDVRRRPDGSAPFLIAGEDENNVAGVLYEGFLLLRELPHESTTRPRGRPKGSGTWRDAMAFMEEAIGTIRLRIEQRKSTKQDDVAKDFNISPRQVREWLDDAGVFWDDLVQEARKQAGN